MVGKGSLRHGRSVALETREIGKIDVHIPNVGLRHQLTLLHDGDRLAAFKLGRGIHPLPGGGSDERFTLIEIEAVDDAISWEELAHVYVGAGRALDHIASTTGADWFSKKIADSRKTPNAPTASEPTKASTMELTKLPKPRSAVTPRRRRIQTI